MESIPEKYKHVVPARRIVEKMIEKTRKEYWELSRKNPWTSSDHAKFLELKQRIMAYESISAKGGK